MIPSILSNLIPIESKYSRTTFHPIKNYIRTKILKFNYVIQIKTLVYFNTDLFKFITLHFKIVSTAIRFLILTYVLHNGSK